MTSNSTKEMNIGKWGLKSGDSKSETELQLYKRENATLKKSLEEILKGKSKMTPEERKRLLEKILALETENEKTKKEFQLLKDKLKSRSKNNEVASLFGQLEEKTKEIAKREQLLTSLSEEVDRLKNQLSAVTTKCAELENRASNLQISQEAAAVCSGSPRNVNEVEICLKDALEKNQQWLIYDQQREAYVHSLLARIFELEQQLETFNQEQAKGTMAEGEKQIYYEQMLAAARNDLEAERQTTAQLHSDLNEFKRKHEQEVMNLNSMLQSQQQGDLQALQEENHIRGQMLQRLTLENEVTREKLEEERKRSQVLLSQVELLHRSWLNQQEDPRIAILEQQIQACMSSFENEKLDRQNLQHQLNKVLKALHKKLPEHGCKEALHNFQTAFEDKLIIQDKSSSPKRSDLLNESFLECPKCKAQYPTSQHRELLTHIDNCED
ncbi:centrosomal protein of 55 kDa [Hemicordylus capensis]|uniref:centrosomal protein of 55 kDa n=1 Tax=Hemicordylus capensis TaxID=884348 RepID=UPI002303B257|nr:centrosomal protein of 55 kDa [Hemicordylus capensis]XP_053168209.1 centrosomal protein of 55 kDa [Hemicordylus capensis]XP_053168210.1 centrosomal protein of 55 kDa [Hemicordylus capensis]